VYCKKVIFAGYFREIRKNCRAKAENHKKVRVAKAARQNFTNCLAKTAISLSKNFQNKP